MSPQKTIIPLLTPIIGMLPVVAFFLIDSFSSYYVALITALVVYTACFSVGVFVFKQKPTYTILLSVCAFLLFLLFSVIPPFNTLYVTKASVFLSFFVIILFSIFLRLKGYFKARLIKKDDSKHDIKLMQFDAELYVIKIVIYILTTYLLIVLFYQLLPANYHSSVTDLIIYHILLLLFVTAHISYEFIHWNNIKKRMANEIWLPIVNETGGVYGKIASSVSREAGNKYLHPVIRIALIHKGRLFLRERNPFPVEEMHYLDYPFERFLLFEESLDEGVRNTFIKNDADPELPYRFIFRYSYKSEESNRLIYLYACNITDEKLLNSIPLSNGKWWTSRQIEDNLGTNLFSPCFEKEYELLNTTVLMAERFLQGLDLED